MTGCKEFRYPSFEIHELIKRPKKSLKPLVFEKYKEKGSAYYFSLYLADEERFVPMRVKVSAGRLNDPSTYEE